MGNRTEISKGQINEFRRLALAMSCFRQARDLCSHVITLELEIESPLYTACIAGIVVSYMRPFVSSDGIGPIAGEFLVFPSRELAATHEEMDVMRNTTYAHHDRIRAAQIHFPTIEDPSPYRPTLVIKKNPDGKWGIFPSVDAPQLTILTLHEVIALCDHQLKKTENQITQLIRFLAGGNTYSPGKYVVGVNFP